MDEHSRNQAILFLILSALCFALMSTFVRLSGDLPVIQKAFFRNLVAVIFAGGMLARRPAGLKLDRQQGKYMLLRSVLGTCGILFNFYAVDHLNLADSSILNKLSPFFAVIASSFLLGESIRKRDILPIFIAFAGALLVIKPGFSFTLLPALAGLCCGLTSGVAYTIVRKLGKLRVPGPVIVFYFSAFSCLVAVPFLIFDYHPMTAGQFSFLMLAGLCAAGGQFTVTAAYTRAPAREVSIYNYVQILFAAMLGFFVLDQIPDLLSVLGYIVIVSCAVVKWRLGRLPDNSTNR